MESILEKKLKLKFPALALCKASALDEGVKVPRVQCAMHVFAQSAKGATVAVSLDSCRCAGANSGFGLSAASTEESFPGGPECMRRFLSSGNEDSEQGRAVAEGMKAHGAPAHFVETFLAGERYKKNPELAAEYFAGLPKLPVTGAHVVIKPLAALKEGETPTAVSLVVDADQLSALVVLANYARPGQDAVRIPFAAGCASVAQLPFFEATQPNPRAVVGLVDITARFYLGPILGREVFTFTAPWSLFREMEENVSSSFLHRPEWQTVTGRRPQ